MSQALSENIRTIRVGISGTSDTESYTLAPGLAQYVEAVYVEVNNGAASGVRPTLTISEQAGVVIAKRRQRGSVSAGNTGSATWALRLSGDDSDDGGLSGIFYEVDNVGDWLNVVTTSAETGTLGMHFETQGGNDIEILADPAGNGALQMEAGLVTIQGDNSGVEIDAINGSNVIVRTGTEGGIVQLDGPSAVTLPQTSAFTVFDVASNTILAAGGGSTGNYGVDVFAGGTGSLNVDVPFELHNIQGGTFRITTCNLADIQATTTQVSGNAVTIDVTNGGAQLVSIDGNVAITLQASQVFQVNDRNGNPKIRWTEGTLDLHIPTGGTVVADL